MPKSLFEIYKNPKSALSHKWRHYFDIYELYFAKFVGQPIRFLEIGVQAGGSLKMWREYFGDQATIIGVDISPECKKLEEDGFIIEIGDMGDPEFLQELKEKLGQLDAIVDDGSHKPHHQILTLNELFPILNEGGIFLCEDIYNSYLYKAGSFVEYTKGLVDELHGWWKADLVGDFFPTQLTKSCGGISFHDGIVVLTKALQEERYDLVSGDFSTAPPQGKPYPEGPYLTKELLESLPTNKDGTTSLHQVPKDESEKLTLEELPPIGELVKRRAPSTLMLCTHDPSAWVLCWGADFEIVDDALQVDGFIRSKEYFLAEAGTKYRCDFYVRPSCAPTNGLPLNFSIGPIALNEKGRIIQHAQLQDDISIVDGGLRRGQVVIEAKAEALGIYVGIKGPAGEPRADALPRFEYVSLTRLPPS